MRSLRRGLGCNRWLGPPLSPLPPSLQHARRAPAYTRLAAATPSQRLERQFSWAGATQTSPILSCLLRSPNARVQRGRVRHSEDDVKYASRPPLERVVGRLESYRQFFTFLC